MHNPNKSADSLQDFQVHSLSFVGIGTHTTPYFSISMQKSRAIISILGVIVFLTCVYGTCELQAKVPTGNRQAKEMTDLQVGNTSIG